MAYGHLGSGSAWVTGPHPPSEEDVGAVVNTGSTMCIVKIHHAAIGKRFAQPSLVHLLLMAWLREISAANAGGFAIAVLCACASETGAIVVTERSCWFVLLRGFITC